MSSSYQLIFRVAFEHVFSADGVLRSLRVVPVAACHEMLRRAGVLLRVQDDGIAAYGDAATVERLRLHIAEAGAPLNMVFEVFATDPHFFEYTLPEWPKGKVLFLDTGCAFPDQTGRQMLHATEYVTESAFLDRAQAAPARSPSKGTLTATQAMLLQVSVSTSLLDEADSRRRHFFSRFDAASSHWKYWLFGAGNAETAIVDLDGDMSFDHFRAVSIADRQRADVFLSAREIPMREVSAARFQLRAVTSAGDKVMINRMPNAGVGGRSLHSKDGIEILVSEIFINH